MNLCMYFIDFEKCVSVRVVKLNCIGFPRSGKTSFICQILDGMQFLILSQAIKSGDCTKYLGMGEKEQPDTAEAIREGDTSRAIAHMGGFVRNFSSMVRSVLEDSVPGQANFHLAGIVLFSPKIIATTISPVEHILSIIPTIFLTGSSPSDDSPKIPDVCSHQSSHKI